ADRNRSHWSTSKTPSYTKSVSWQHHPETGVCSVKKIITSSTYCFLTLFRTGAHITASNKNAKLNQYS
ncbi:hypothetical protein EIA21_28500, partial [Escherichia coli]